MSLKVIRRKDKKNALQIVGTVAGQFIRRSPQSRSIGLAREEAAALEAKLLREEFHGRRSGDRPFAEIAAAYLKHEPRSAGVIQAVAGVVRALGPDKLACEVDQECIDDLRAILLRPNPAPATVRRNLITPVSAVLNFGFLRRWCDRASFQLPRMPKGRTRFLTPDEAGRLVAAAAPHLRPLLVFLFCVGSRIGETLALDWERDIDLVNARAIIVQKGKRLRIAQLSPAAVAALASLPHREGPVFRWQSQNGRRQGSYAPRNHGGQIKTAWNAALRRAGLAADLTPHVTRHSYASWHYALYRDVVRLMRDGGWETIAMVQRYAHLMPGGHELDVAQFWGLPAAPADAAANLLHPSYTRAEPGRASN
jgi:integrase